MKILCNVGTDWREADTEKKLNKETSVDLTEYFPRSCKNDV